MTPSDAPLEAPAQSGASRLSPWKVIVALVALAVLFALGRQAGGAVETFARWIDGLGAIAPLVFALGYAVATVAFVPGSLLTLAAGAIFGLAEGTAVVFVAAVLGSTAAFLVARYVARDAVERWVAGDERFARIDRAVEGQGWKIVLLLRLSPVFPFNYALGLTRVRLGHYLIGSLGMIPGTLLYVYSGKLAGTVAAAAGSAGPERGTGYWTVLALGFVATVAVTVLVTRTARRALRDATGA